MAAPTKPFTSIPDSAIDPDSPLTTGLMTDFRDNDENFNSQLIGETSPFVAAEKHDHDGVNSALVAGNLVTTGGGTTFTLTGAPASTSKRLLIEIWAHVTTDRSGNVTADTAWAIGASIAIDLSVVEFDGVGRIIVANQDNAIAPTGTTTQHNPTALADNTFTTVVTHTFGDDTVTVQIRFNQTTEVFDIQFTGATFIASGIGMRVVEFA